MPSERPLPQSAGFPWEPSLLWQALWRSFLEERERRKWVKLRRARGPHHAATLTQELDYLTVRWGWRDGVEAREEVRLLLARARRHLGWRHRVTLSIRSQWAEALEADGDLPAAERVWRRLVFDYRRSRWPVCWPAIFVTRRYSECLSQQWKFPLALKVIRRLEREIQSHPYKKRLHGKGTREIRERCEELAKLWERA